MASSSSLRTWLKSGWNSFDVCDSDKWVCYRPSSFSCLLLLWFILPWISFSEFRQSFDVAEAETAPSCVLRPLSRVADSIHGSRAEFDIIRLESLVAPAVSTDTVARRSSVVVVYFVFAPQPTSKNSCHIASLCLVALSQHPISLCTTGQPSLVLFSRSLAHTTNQQDKRHCKSPSEGPGVFSFSTRSNSSHGTIQSARYKTKRERGK